MDFISDLHLRVDEPQTFHDWATYLQTTVAQAVFILGDLFEVWVGDDILASHATSLDARFERECVNVLRAAAHRTRIFLMPGNRDFLIGHALSQASSCTVLPDPSVLEFGSKRWLLSHGDAFCLDDTNYMQFRAVVRSPQWQRDFLAKPLSERLNQARQMRRQSEELKRSTTVYADVDTACAMTSLQAEHADYMIHGHTHSPGQHQLSPQHQRLVLSDWDTSTQPPRSEVLRLRLERLDPHDTTEQVVIQRLSPKSAATATMTTETKAVGSLHQFATDPKIVGHN